MGFFFEAFYPFISVSLGEPYLCLLQMFTIPTHTLPRIPSKHNEYAFSHTTHEYSIMITFECGQVSFIMTMVTFCVNRMVQQSESPVNAKTPTESSLPTQTGINLIHTISIQICMW